MTFTLDVASTQDVLAAVLSSSLPPLPAQEQPVGATTVSWWETDPGVAYIHAEGGTADDRHYASVLVELALAPHGFRRAQFDLDQPGEIEEQTPPGFTPRQEGAPWKGIHFKDGQVYTWQIQSPSGPGASPHHMDGMDALGCGFDTPNYEHGVEQYLGSPQNSYGHGTNIMNILNRKSASDPGWYDSWVGNPAVHVPQYGMEFKSYGDGVPGGYNGGYSAHDPQTGAYMGHIDYNSANNDAVIADLQVHPDYQRQGVATKLFDYAQRYDPDMTWSHGMTTPEGEAWKQSLGHRDVIHPASRRTASWPDVMAKAKRLVESGNVTLLRNGYQNVIGHVIGDHGEYDTEFSRDDPDSRAITQWQCSCPWDQYAWQRTRKWKKFEGRPCSHVMALYWKALQTPIDEEMDQQQAEGMGTGQAIGDGSMEGMPPPGAKTEGPGPDSHEHSLPRSFGPEGDIIQGDQQQLNLPPEAIAGPPGPAQAPLAPPPGQGAPAGPGAPPEGPGGPTPPGILPPFPGAPPEQVPWGGPGTTPGGGVSPPGAYTVPGAKPPNQPNNPLQNPGTYSSISINDDDDEGYSRWWDDGSTEPVPVYRGLHFGYGSREDLKRLKADPHAYWQSVLPRINNGDHLTPRLKGQLGTYWTADPEMAKSYALDNHPWESWYGYSDGYDQPTDERPHPHGIVLHGLAAPDQLSEPEDYGAGEADEEAYVHGPVTLTHVTGVWPGGEQTQPLPLDSQKREAASQFTAPEVVKLKKDMMGVAEGPVPGQYGDGQYRDVPIGTTGEVLSQDPSTGWVEAIFAIPDSGNHEPFHVRCFLEPSDIEATDQSNAFIQRRASDKDACYTPGMPILGASTHADEAEVAFILEKYAGQLDQPGHALWFKPSLGRNAEPGRGLIHDPTGTVHTWPESEGTHASMMYGKGLPDNECSRFYIQPNGVVSQIMGPSSGFMTIMNADPALARANGYSA